MQTNVWPPAELEQILPAMDRWDAWYASRTDKLASLYARGGDQRPSFQKDGLFGTVRRFFWGTTGGSVPTTKLHLPVASDLCQASADLLFAEPPVFTVDGDTNQKRLDLIIGEDAHDQLASAAEVGAALGGTYVRVAWDIEVAGHPFLTRVDADRALPEFRWGRLASVTFWRTVRVEGGTMWRHLERHYVDETGTGMVQHTLNRGTSDTLGRMVSLTEATATAGLPTDGDGMVAEVSTLSPGLDVVYVPNQSPNRTWRNHPLGANLGRSDLDGIEHLMDALDEAWSSWMRDLRLGKARVVASRAAIEDLGPGKGAQLDLDREVYEAVNTPPSAANQEGGLPLKPIQFGIRVQEHQQTCDALLAQILRTAGYSAQTFGAADAGAAMTATEVQSRERRSFLTRDRKIRPWRPALAYLAQKALAIDSAVFRSGADGATRVQVEFGDSVQEAPEVVARTAQALFQAQAASTKTRVQMLHPEWDDDAVDREVAAILNELGTEAPDPDALGVEGFGLATPETGDDQP